MAISESKRKRIVYATFIVAVLWGLYMQPWSRPSRTTEPAPSESTTENIVHVVIASSQGAMVAPNDIGDDLSWSPDPFRTLDAIVETPEAISVVTGFELPTLQGTMNVSGERVCVLNGDVYRTGDAYGRWRITDVGDGTAVLTAVNNETVTLATHSLAGVVK